MFCFLVDENQFHESDTNHTDDYINILIILN